MLGNNGISCHRCQLSSFTITLSRFYLKVNKHTHMHEPTHPTSHYMTNLHISKHTHTHKHMTNIHKNKNKHTHTHTQIPPWQKHTDTRYTHAHTYTFKHFHTHYKHTHEDTAKHTLTKGLAKSDYALSLHFYERKKMFLFSEMC
jgi:hypothetical protein